MGSGRSLRRRLTLTYTATLAVGLLIFATLSLAAIDRNLRSTLDARLATTIRAFAATATGHIGVSAVDPTVVGRIREEIGVAQNGAVVEDSGTILMHSGEVQSTVLQVAQLSDTESDADAIAFATVPEHGGIRVAAMRVAGAAGDATLVVWRPLDVINDYERIALVTLLGASFVIVLGAFLAGRFIVDRGLRPLREMASIASEIEERDLSRRLTNDGWDDELRTFATTFDRMLDRLQAAFQRQRQFTADASHDLRAPLSVMRAEADLALARPRAADDDRASFESIRDEVTEFDHLLEALLLSARADAEPVGATPVDLQTIAARATSRLAPFARSRSVTIENVVDGPAWVHGSADILERVLASLLHNGVKFSPESGRVFVELQTAGDAAALIVRDEGPGFSADALAHGFDRFWRGDSARGRSGSGLGLSITKSAVERMGGSVALRNAAGGGGEVEMRFPRLRT